MASDVIFPEEYKCLLGCDSARESADAGLAIDLLRTGKAVADLFSANGFFVLKTFRADAETILSDAVSALDNLGFKVYSREAFSLSVDGSRVWMEQYILGCADGVVCDIGSHDTKPFVTEAFLSVVDKKFVNRPLNRIMYLGKLDIGYVRLVMAYITYAKQTGFEVGLSAMASLLTQHYQITLALINQFIAKFGPVDDGIREVDRYRGFVLESLSSIKDEILTRVITTLIKLIDATTRTNFYRSGQRSEDEFVVLKIESSQLGLSARPVAFAEIFVFSDDFEAVHIRNGAVARGGLRWSDRGDDYRNEVFSLAKTQVAKNSIIVPTGSKGGFYVKKANASKDFGIECYKSFLRGMLSITDNIVDGKVVHPEIEIYDKNDPYLVVAADKGTSTFSDYANKLSADCGFWLQDAFASGGSNGYDHKKLAITARGVWEGVTRHLLECGINIETDSVIATGIGSMVGDVFGNGMLYSRNIKLVAAFDQSYIFLDPSPNCEKSYGERTRLFNALGDWGMYDKSILSKGGGVYSRTDKNIRISSEAAYVLGVPESIYLADMTGDMIVGYILRAKVDLLFNGGIGTFVKSTSESHANACDKANDIVRINGKELGAKIVAEGGNLGMTQAGRIEYAMAGGRCNTDAIDNSAGVSCSDHEVNIKIALNIAVSDQKISMADRNRLLSDMQAEVCEAVLRDNKLQTSIISVVEQLDGGVSSAGKYSNLINTLEEAGLITRHTQSLPSDQEIISRSMSGKGLVRPEISVLLSYSKIHMKNAILATDIYDHAYCSDYLFSYFPKQMYHGFAAYINVHPLKKEIVVNAIVNEFINILGPCAFVDIQNTVGHDVRDILIAYIAIRKVFDIDNIVSEIEGLSGTVPLYVVYSAYHFIAEVLKRNICTVLSVFGDRIDDIKSLDIFINMARDMHYNYRDIDTNPSNHTASRVEEAYVSDGLPKSLSDNLIAMTKLRGVIPCAAISVKTGCKSDDVMRLYNGVDDAMSLMSIKGMMSRDKAANYWDFIAILRSLQSLTVLHFDIVLYLLAHNKEVGFLMQKCSAFLSMHNTYLRKLGIVDASILAVSSFFLDSIRNVERELKK